MLTISIINTMVLSYNKGKQTFEIIIFPIPSQMFSGLIRVGHMNLDLQTGLQFALGC
jgi:uncharacterized membrane protein